jgi:hypothetical protein
MRSLPLALLLFAAGCAREDNDFTVEDEQGLVRTAVLELCGKETPLQRDGRRLTVIRTIDCEGDGRIRLTYRTGEHPNCMIGYVTGGARQSFRFQASPSGCKPLWPKVAKGS